MKKAWSERFKLFTRLNSALRNKPLVWAREVVAALAKSTTDEDLWILARLIGLLVCAFALCPLMAALGYVPAAMALLLGFALLVGISLVAPRLGYSGLRLRITLVAADAVVIGALAAIAGSFMIVFLLVVLVELARLDSPGKSILASAGLAGLIAIMLPALLISGPADWPLVPLGAQPIFLLVSTAAVLAFCSLLLVDLGDEHKRVVSVYEHEQAVSAAEMHVAHEVQQKLLAPPEWQSGDWLVVSSSIPAREVGGDFYEYIPAQGNILGGIAIGDVSGKGMPAALLMAVVRTVFRIEARRRIFPAETLAHVNQSLRTEMPTGMVTLLYAYIDPVGNLLHFANAGHNYPIVMINGRVTELELPGLPLGIADESEYRERSVRLPQGCSVLFYTDGLVEAQNAAGEMFGFERLLSLLGVIGHLPAHELVERLTAEVRDFSAAAQSDDITLVLLQHTVARQPEAAQRDAPPITRHEQDKDFPFSALTNIPLGAG